MTKTILVTGASGTVGKKLIPLLKTSGYNIRILTTQKGKQDYENNIFYWNPQKNIIDSAAIIDIDFIIHLAGANVGNQRWTANYKKEILESRVQSANMLWEACNNLGKFPEKFISASGTGYYDDPSTELLVESSPNGATFLSEVCSHWEKAALRFEEKNTTVTILRTGPVLSKNDGLLKAFIMALPFRIIPTTGSKNNLLSWIHVNDLCEIYLKACNENMHGIFNACSPNYCTQMELADAIGVVLNRSIFSPNVPAFLLKLGLGERAALALSSQKVSVKKLIKTGFIFQYPDIHSALKNLLVEK